MSRDNVTAGARAGTVAGITHNDGGDNGKCAKLIKLNH